jgi:hypothetical protein
MLKGFTVQISNEITESKRGRNLVTGRILQIPALVAVVRCILLKN